MDNDIQKQIKEIQDRARFRERNLKRNRAKSRVTQVEEDAKFFYRFWLQLVAALFWIWQKILRPISSFFWKIGLWVFSLYRKAWSFSVYRRNEFGDLIFSKLRAAAFLIFVVPITLLSANIAVDTSIFAATHKSGEVVYLFNSNDDSFGDRDHFSVTGCEKKSDSAETGFVCDSEDTVYFRVEGTWFEHAWSILTKGHIFYSDSIGSAIAPGWNECVTDSWYFRLKILYRNTNFYPHLLAATCRPVSTGIN